MGNQLDDITIRTLSGENCRGISEAFETIGWNKPEAQYIRYLSEQEQGHCKVFVAFIQNVFVGYVTVLWKSAYEGFANACIPEIQDLNVLA